MSTKWLLVIYGIMLLIMGMATDGICECREEVYSPIPGFSMFGIGIHECFFPNTTEFRNAPKPSDGWDLNIDLNKIPESATNIYYFTHSARDSMTYFSLTLPHEEAIKFTEMLTDIEIRFLGEPPISISEFRELGPGTKFIEERKSVTGEIWSVEVIPSSVIKGPKRGKWNTSHWNLKDVKNGKYYYKERRLRFVAIDLDASRVYFCKWTM